MHNPDRSAGRKRNKDHHPEMPVVPTPTEKENPRAKRMPLDPKRQPPKHRPLTGQHTTPSAQVSAAQASRTRANREVVGGAATTCPGAWPMRSPTTGIAISKPDIKRLTEGVAASVVHACRAQPTPRRCQTRAELGSERSQVRFLAGASREPCYMRPLRY
jgi:hypothetical protein